MNDRCLGNIGVHMPSRRLRHQGANGPDLESVPYGGYRRRLLEAAGVLLLAGLVMVIILL